MARNTKHKETNLVIILLIHSIEGFNHKVRPNINTLIDLKSILHSQSISETHAFSTKKSNPKNSLEGRM